MNKKIKSIFGFAIIIGIISSIVIPISLMRSKLPSRLSYTKPDVVQKFNIINNSTDVSSEAIEELRLNLSNGLTYGPEAMGLKDIKIQDKSHASFPSDEGDYLKNEIYINTTWLNQLQFKNKDDVAEYLYELIFHEYNHHIDHSYLMNILPTNANSTKEIYSGNLPRAVQLWPKAFVDEFKKQLNYDKETPLYKEGDIESGKISIGSVYNAKQLFDIANGKDEPSFSKLKGNEYRAPINPVVDLKFALVNSSELEYKNTMDELFARKMQIKNMVYFPTVRDHSDGFDLDGYMRSNDKIWPSPYIQDILNYKRGFGDGGEYLADNAKDADLEPLFNNALGLGKDVTYLVNATSDKIKFGGFVDSEYSTIGYMENKVFVPIKINKNKGYYSLSDTEVATCDYYLTDSISPNLIISKELYFSTDDKGTKKRLVKDIKQKKYGDVTTFRFDDHDLSGQYVFDESGKLQLLN